MMRKLQILFVLGFALACHAQTWGTLTVDFVTNMNTSTPGTSLTTTIANTGTSLGGNCTSGTCHWSSVGTGFTVGSFQNASSNLGPVQLANGGSLFAAQSLNYNNVAHADVNNNNNLEMIFSGTPASSKHIRELNLLTIGFPYQPGSGSDNDASILFDVAGHYAVWPQLNNDCGGSNANGARLEVQPTAHSPCVAISPAATYYFASGYDPTNGDSSGYVYTTGGTFVGAVSAIAGSFGNNGLTSFYIGNNENDSNAGTTSYFQNAMVDFTTAFPSGSAATVTNGSATVTGLIGCGTTWAVPSVIFLPNSSDSVNYLVGSCNSTTSAVLTTTYSGSTVTGTAAWETQPPLFWQNTALQVGVVAPGRSIAWNAGVPGGIPTGRTQCVNTQCATVTSAGASSTSAQINSAIANAPANTYVLLPAGTYSSATGCILMGISNVTLRGAGANQTFLAPTSTSGCGGGSIGMVSTSNSAGSPQNGPVAVTGSTVQGSKTLTLASVPNLKVGNPIILDQLDPTVDTGGIFVSGTGSSYTPTATSPGVSGPYNTIGGGNGIRGGSGCAGSPTGCYHQQQIVTVTQCDGNTTAGHSCSSGANITISPSLHMPNWSTANMFAWWATSPIQADGVEDLSIDSTGNSGANGIEIENCQGCWVKGVTSIDTSEAHVQMLYSNQTTIRNNYFFLTQNSAAVSYGAECFSCSDALVENNIFHAVTTPMITNGPGSGVVYDYNFTINQYFNTANYSIPARGDHAADSHMILTEGNISNGITADVIHGTSNMETYFRNLFTTAPACYVSGSTYATTTYGACTSGITTIENYAFHRFNNYVGNILGTSGTQTTYCNGGSSCGSGFTANNTNVLGMGYGNSPVPNDPNTVKTVMLWGNADPVTGYGSPRFNASEVPVFPPATTVATSVFGVQFPYLNSAPATTNLPASFYYSSKPSWWPSGKPWPIIGPDVTGGNLLICSGGAQTRAIVTSGGQCPSGTTSTAVNGEAYSNPAMDCYLGAMNGPANGVTTSALSFNEATCYSSSTPTSAAPQLFFTLP